MTETQAERLARLTRQTSALSPAPGFESRVLARVAALAAPTWSDAALGSWRWSLPALVLVASLAGYWAHESQVSARAALAASAMEVEWQW